MRVVTLLALWFTVYGNINKTGIKQLVTDFKLMLAIGANFTCKSFQLTFTRENQ